MTRPEHEAPARPQGWRRALRFGLGALAVGLLASAAIADRAAIAAALGLLHGGTVALSLALVLLGLWFNMLSWRDVLSSLGSPLPVAVAGRVYFVAQIGKYLPGSIWPVLAQVELAHDHGIPRLRSGIAAIAALLVGLIVGTLVAAATLVPTSGNTRAGSWWWALLIAAAAAAILHPRTLRWLVGLGLRLSRRSDEAVPVDGRLLLRSSIWSLLMWLSLGGHLYLLAREIGAMHSHLFLLCVGAYAAAWVAGLLVIIAPAGAGIREAALIVTLAPALDRGDTLAIAIVSRGLTLLGDVACAGGAAVGVRLREARRRAPRSSCL